MSDSELDELLSELEEEIKVEQKSLDLKPYEGLKKILLVLSRSLFFLAIIFLLLVFEKINAILKWDSTSIFSILSIVASVASLTLYYGYTRAKKA